MRSFFEIVVGGRSRRPSQPRTRLGVEELNARVLPSAGCSMAAAGASSSGSAAAQSARVAFLADSSDSSGDHGGHGGHGCDHGQGHATLSASLSNATGATGTATFSDSNGVLKVTVTGAAANSTLSVTVTDNGTTTTVGNVTTDASGNGTAKFDGVTLAAGDTIAVGDLNGTFAKVKLTAALSGDTGVTGSASFNSLRNQLKVSATGLTAGTTYDVAVNGTVVGQVTANPAGRARFHVTPSGLTVTAGSIITLTVSGGTSAVLTGTLA